MTGESSLDRAVTAPRSATEREWEVFVRESPRDALTHAGSVTAPDRDVAVDQAEQTLGWAAEAVWLCPADEMVRRQTNGATLG